MAVRGRRGAHWGVVGFRRAAERGVCRWRAFPPPASAQAVQYANQGLVGPVSASSQTREQVQQAAGGHGASTQPFNYSRPGDGDVSAGDTASQDANLTSRLSARLPRRVDSDDCVCFFIFTYYLFIYLFVN